MDTAVEYVRKVLTRTPGTEVIDVQSSSGCGDGDNATGSLLAISATIKFDGQQNVVNFILKSSETPYFDDQTTFTRRYRLFMKEANFLGTILPRLMTFQDKIGAKPVELQIPKYIDSVTEVPGIYDRILLQDMTVFGFKMVDKSKDLQDDEVVLALSEIARLHGLSYAYKVSNKVSLLEEFPALKEYAFCAEEKMHSRYVTYAHYQEAIKYMIEVGESDIAKRLKKFSGIEFETINPVLNAPSSDPYQVICHGDFWKNNLLFQYGADNKPTRCCLIDFQQIRTTSLMQDLLYFLYTSTSRRQRQKHLTEWLQHHRTIFLNTINYLKVTPPKEFTYENYQTKFNDSLPYALIFMSFAMVFQQSDESALLEFLKDPFPYLKNPDDNENVDDVTEAVKKCFRSGKVKERLLEIFQDMIDFGVI